MHYVATVEFRRRYATRSMIAEIPGVKTPR
jgi:hypothetical protein